VTGAYGAHLELAALTGTAGLLRPTGWLKLFRTRRGFETTLLQRQLMDLHDIKYDILDPDEIHQLEPHLARLFVKGLFHGESASITLPKRLIEGYAHAFVQAPPPESNTCRSSPGRPVHGNWALSIGPCRS